MSDLRHHTQDDLIARLHEAGFNQIDSDAVARRDWWGLIAFATSERYWQCFDVVAPFMSDAEYAATARELWVAANGLPPADARRRLIEHGRSITRRMWMTDEDAAAFAILPDPVIIYRGCVLGREDGWSWTLSYESAEYFANWPSPDPPRPRLVLSGTAVKSEIVALFSGNWEEDEVIVPGDRVHITRRDELE